MTESVGNHGWHERQSDQMPLKLALEWYIRGRTQVHHCDAVGAEDSFRKALKLVPEMPEALGGLASVYIGHGAFRKTLEFAERAVASDPAYSRGWLNRSVAKQCLMDMPGAIADAILATKLTPEYTMPWVILADLYCDLDPPRLTEAQNAIEATESLADEDGSVTSAKIDLLYAMGETAKAKAVIVETHKLQYLPMIKRRLLSSEATIAIGEGRFEEARTILFTLTEPPYSSFRYTAACSWYQLANLAASNDSPPEQLGEALQYATIATSLCAETPEFLSKETWLRIQLASHMSGYPAVRMLNEAMTSADAAVEITPEDIDLRMLRASAARNLAWHLGHGVQEYSIQQRLAAFLRGKDCSGRADVLDQKAVDDLTNVLELFDKNSHHTAEQQSDLEYVLAERADSFASLGRYVEAIADIQRLRIVSRKPDAEKELFDDCMQAREDRQRRRQ